jgi:S1-C subfamily serine protease
MVRIADPASRVSALLPTEIPAETIYQRNTSAVFMIETFRSSGRSIRTGSGFFISEDGHAVTCLHVLENAASAKITLLNGDEYDVLGAVAVSHENNLVILSIGHGRRDFNYLHLADSDIIKTGGIVYALGSPRSLLNAITEGIVSNTDREVSGDSLIQFTAPISFGSGGSPVLNTLGQVIGVASSSFTHAQNLNLAIRVNYIKELQIGPIIPLEVLNA